MNLADPIQARIFTDREFKKILEDITYETAKHLEVDQIFVIKNHNSTIGAEPGSVFIVTKSKDDSLALLKAMKDCKYNGRDYKMVCIPEDTYKLYFERLAS